MTESNLRVGELFFLGFRGPSLPSWLLEFERRFGLGGVILFDYNCQTRTYENNIESPEQIKQLNQVIAALPSHPLILVDQEGGKVRRLKESRGFAPLPSAKEFAKISSLERIEIAYSSFREQRELGFHYDLAPVIDLDLNPNNPDIGKVERSFSVSANVVRTCALDLNEAAKKADLGLCLKHFPGLGAASVNSHEELTDLSGTMNDEQLQLFYDLGLVLHGGAILLSHGIVREWDPQLPVSMSEFAVQRLRQKVPHALLLTDDLQMQGLQKILPTASACIQTLRAGSDGILIGNNLIAEDEKCLSYAQGLQDEIGRDASLRKRAAEAVNRIAYRKKRFYPGV